MEKYVESEVIMILSVPDVKVRDFFVHNYGACVIMGV